MALSFKHPLEKHPNELDITMLLRLCDVHNIPLASKTAELLMKDL